MPEIDLAAPSSGGADEGPTGLDAFIEPVEEEITAQHHLVGRRAPTRPDTSELQPRAARAGDQGNGDGGRERARTQGDVDDGDEDTSDGEQTGEKPAGRIGAADSAARKQSSDPPA